LNPETLYCGGEEYKPGDDGYDEMCEMYLDQFEGAE